ncbi:MAG: hypothetical protein EOM50_21500 [Erysipelotrichia bacterium]|nr:hypothetical protein [Erysipelotrichia bacterium]
MPQITLSEAAFLIKQKIPVVTQDLNELDYALKLARQLYMLSSTTSIFSQNMSNIGSNPQTVLNQLKLIPHYQRLEKINKDVFDYLDGLDDDKKQSVAEYYLFDDEIPFDEKVEQLYQIGLV